MPPDPNQPQNSISTENPLPTSPQEPTADAPIPTTVSTPAEVPPGATEAPGTSFSAESNNIAPSNSTLTEPTGEQKPQEIQAPSDAEALADKQNEPLISEPVEAPEPSADAEAKADKEKAQMGRNEPLPANGEAKGESSQTQTSRHPVREVLAKAQLAIQNKKRKKLDSILTLFAKRTTVTNDEVEKFLHVSDATATRYLSILEKENKIKQSGKIGKGVSYSRV